MRHFLRLILFLCLPALGIAQPVQRIYLKPAAPGGATLQTTNISYLWPGPTGQVWLYAGIPATVGFFAPDADGNYRVEYPQSLRTGLGLDTNQLATVLPLRGSAAWLHTQATPSLRGTVQGGGIALYNGTQTQVFNRLTSVPLVSTPDSVYTAGVLSADGLIYYIQTTEGLRRFVLPVMTSTLVPGFQLRGAAGVSARPHLVGGRPFFPLADGKGYFADGPEVITAQRVGVDTLPYLLDMVVTGTNDTLFLVAKAPFQNAEARLYRRLGTLVEDLSIRYALPPFISQLTLDAAGRPWLVGQGEGVFGVFGAGIKLDGSKGLPTGRLASMVASPTGALWVGTDTSALYKVPLLYADVEAQDTLISHACRQKVRLVAQAGAASLPIASYTWHFGDGDSSVGTSAEHAYRFAGTYQPKLVVRGAGSLLQIQKLKPVLVALGDTVNIAGLPAQIGCKPPSLAISGYGKVRWVAPADTNRFIRATRSGSYQAELTDNGGCVTTKTIEVVLATEVSGSIRLFKESVVFDESVIQQEEALLLEAQLTSNATICARRWTLNGAQNSEEATYPIALSETGTYEIKVLFESTDSCFGQATKILSVQILVIPNVITPNGDDKNDTFLPSGSGGYTLDVYTKWGQKVYSGSASIWPTPETLSGTYYFALQTPNGQKKSGWVEVVK